MISKINRNVRDTLLASKTSPGVSQDLLIKYQNRLFIYYIFLGS